MYKTCLHESMCLTIDDGGETNIDEDGLAVIWVNNEPAIILARLVTEQC